MDHLVSYSFLSFLNFSIKNSLVHSRYTGLDPSLLIRLLRTLFSVILYPRHVLIILSRKLPAAAGSSASSLVPSQHSEVDIVTLRQGIKLARTIGSTAPFKDALGAEVTPGPDVQTDADIENWLRNTAGTEFHPCGACAMLPKAQGGVVDANLKVYGLCKSILLIDLYLERLLIYHLQRT